MPHYLVKVKFTAESQARFASSPHERATSASLIADAFGGKLKGYYFALGEWDSYAIYEFPSNINMTAMSMKIMATGGFANIATTPLLTPSESEDAMLMARTAKTLYRAPNS
jgi:uncharacterized protein with GYD domain